MWRKIGCAALVVLVIAAIVAIVIKQQSGDDGGWFKTSKGKKDEDQKSFFEPVRRGNLDITVEATGSTEPITDIDVKSEATGRITEFYVDEGDKVAVGDLICKLDQSNQLLVVQQREIAVKQAKLAYNESKTATSASRSSSLGTALEAAEVRLSNAKDTLEKERSAFGRIQGMYDKGFASKQEIESAEARVDNAVASVDSAQSALNDTVVQMEQFDGSSNASAIEQARLSYDSAKVFLKEAQKQLGDSVIVSPIDGIILEKQMDVGDSVVSINSSFGGASTIVRVADMSKIQVRTNVDEIDIGKIAVGQSATVTVDTYRDLEFSGLVTNVFPQGSQQGTGLISFVVMVEIDNSDNLLLGRMTSTVKILTQGIEDVLLVPLAATRAGEEKDTDIVYILAEDEDEFEKDAKSDEKVVVLGDTDFTDVVVTEGLEEGDLVKVRGFKSSINFGE